MYIDLPRPVQLYQENSHAKQELLPNELAHVQNIETERRDGRRVCLKYANNSRDAGGWVS